MRSCSICHNDANNQVFAAKEMLQGTRELFYYLECSQCYCVQLIDPPKDMRNYYNNVSYGSFEEKSLSPIKRLIRRIRNSYAIRGNGGILGRFLFSYFPIPVDFCVVGQYAKIESSILDVGCGRGNYVSDLYEIGYKRAEGIDPFISEDFQHVSGARIRKLYVEDVTEEYDVVLSHHSLEHVHDPLSTLKGIKKCMKDDGVFILTVPVADELYRMFADNCYLIQAPQHFFLFSLRSIEHLAEMAGFKIEKTIREIETNYDWYKISYLWSQNKTLSEVEWKVDENIPLKKLLTFQSIISNGKLNQRGDNVIFVMKKV